MTCGWMTLEYVLELLTSTVRQASTPQNNSMQSSLLPLLAPGPCEPLVSPSATYIIPSLITLSYYSLPHLLIQLFPPFSFSFLLPLCNSFLLPPPQILPSLKQFAPLN